MSLYSTLFTKCLIMRRVLCAALCRVSNDFSSTSGFDILLFVAAMRNVNPSNGQAMYVSGV